MPHASPLTNIGDVSVAAPMFDRLREHNNQYNRAIEALIATQCIIKGWDKSEPAMSLSVQRDVLVALDDTQALADFDRDHGEALERERTAQQQAAAAKAFVQAWREMQTIEAVLSGMTHQFHYSVTGNLLTSPALDLIGETRNGDLDCSQPSSADWRNY